MGLMGHAFPQTWQGRNLTQAILDKDDEAVEEVPIFNFKPSWRGVFTRRYTFAIEQVQRTADLQNVLGSDLGRKYTPSYNVFYDRLSDPLQVHNLINSTEHIPLAMELTERVHAWCRKFRDPFLSYNRLIELVGDIEDKPPIDVIQPLHG
jgi:hypothetical protein